MTYPYIGKGTESGSIALIYGEDSAIVMDSKTWAAKNSEDTEVDESYFKNITAECLANTYGEVKSKEHAEFIVKLAEVNGIDFDGEVGINSNYFCFFPSNSKQLTFWRKEKDASKHGNRKQITIPLPPECESVDEFKFDNLDEANKAVNLLEERFQSLSDLQTETANLLQNLMIEGVDVEAFNDILKDKERSERFGAFIDWRYSVASKMKEINVKQKSSIDEAEADGMKMIERAKNNEWPKVGSRVTWGTKAVNGEVKAIDNDNDFAWVKNDYGNYVTVYVGHLVKPKTPEQELRDEISDLAFNQFNDDSYDLTHNSYYLAEQLISKYNIKKKGEGDE